MADVTMHPSLMPKLVPSLLWCEGVGGDNQFVDGFAVAEKIRREEPEMFKLLRQAALRQLEPIFRYKLLAAYSRIEQTQSRSSSRWFNSQNLVRAQAEAEMLWLTQYGENNVIWG